MTTNANTTTKRAYNLQVIFTTWEPATMVMKSNRISAFARVIMWKSISSRDRGLMK